MYVCMLFQFQICFPGLWFNVCERVPRIPNVVLGSVACDQFVNSNTQDKFDKKVLANHLADRKRVLKCLACAPEGLRPDIVKYTCTSCGSTSRKDKFVASQAEDWKRGKSKTLKCKQCRATKD